MNPLGMLILKDWYLDDNNYTEYVTLMIIINEIHILKKIFNMFLA